MTEVPKVNEDLNKYSNLISEEVKVKLDFLALQVPKDPKVCIILLIHINIIIRKEEGHHDLHDNGYLYTNEICHLGDEGEQGPTGFEGTFGARGIQGDVIQVSVAHQIVPFSIF